MSLSRQRQSVVIAPHHAPDVLRDSTQQIAEPQAVVVARSSKNARRKIQRVVERQCNVIRHLTRTGCRLPSRHRPVGYRK
jgi:meiotically up-regulated gene 157 (Mug157) protein